MSKHVLRWMATCVLSVVVVAAVAGCWNPFAPGETDDSHDIDIQYKLRTSPDNVIYNLNTAYKWMNAEQYLACLAEDFVFTLNPEDYENPDSELPPSWGKQEERDIHQNMFADTTNVDRIDLTLTYQWYVYDTGAEQDDPYDDRFTYREGTDLRVWVGEYTYWANADQEFVFKIDQDEVGPHGETLWEIAEWFDIQKPDDGKIRADDGSGTEEVSFGRLKSMFR